jgi:hypothetical protein
MQRVGLQIEKQSVLEAPAGHGVTGLSGPFEAHWKRKTRIFF